MFFTYKNTLFSHVTLWKKVLAFNYMVRYEYKKRFVEIKLALRKKKL